MKLAIIISDCAAAVHAGGQVETTVREIEIPDDTLPPAVREFFKWREDAEKRGASSYGQIAFAEIRK